MAEQKRRALRIVLIVLVVLVVLPVVGAAVVALTFDANRLKPRITAAIEQATGRAVTIDGPIRLGIALQPTLQVGDVKLANAPGFAPANMATLDTLDLRLALLPLLHRHIEIEQLDLGHPVIALQIDADGQNNWHFQSKPTAPQPQTPAASGAARPTTLRVDTTTVANGAISLTDARTGASFGIEGVQLTATQSDPAGPIHVDVTAKDGAMPIAVSGQIGSPRERAMSVDLTVSAADASLTAKGTRERFAVAGSVPDLAALSPLANRPLPALHAITFQSDVTPPQDGPMSPSFQLEGLRIASSVGDLDGSVAIDLAKPIAVRATATIRNLDPKALSAALPADASPVAPPQAAPTSPPPTPPAPTPPSKSGAAWVIPDHPLPFARLPLIDADLTLALQDTKIGDATIKSVTTHAVLHAGHLVLDPLAIDGPGGHVDATAMAAAAGAAAITLQAPALAIQPVLAAFDQPDGVIGTMEVRADLHSSGLTPHALAAGLDGSFGLALANGEIDNRLLVAMLSRIAPEAGLLETTGRAQRAALRCVALRADVSHGVADLRALMFDTEPLRLVGSGSIDLGQETLSLRLQPLARIGISGFSMPIDVRGGFRSPRATFDVAGGGKSMGGLVIGALGADRLIAGAGQSDGCADQLKLARFGASGPLPAALPAPLVSKTLTPNINNLLKQLLR
jgi:uncharacterized protein involved in outer membrane biogenesis